MTQAALMIVAQEIAEAHEAACLSARSAIDHARRAGEMLLQVKAQLEHGRWLPWLAEHCPTLSPRTAQSYMRVARSWPELEAKTPRVADLPIRQVLALLAEPRPPAEIPARLQIDWPSRTATMEAAYDDLDAALDELNARIRLNTDLDAAVDALHEATELEGRAIALQASTIRDLRRLTHELASLLKLPVSLVQPLTKPERMEAFLAACRARIAELEATS